MLEERSVETTTDTVEVETTPRARLAPEAVADNTSQTSTPMRWVYRIPVVGWALECVFDDDPTVRRTGLATLVLLGLLLPLTIGEPALVFFSLLVGMAAYAGYLVAN